jgi:hypothetical protein
LFSGQPKAPVLKDQYARWGKTALELNALYDITLLFGRSRLHHDFGRFAGKSRIVRRPGRNFEINEKGVRKNQSVGDSFPRLTASIDDSMVRSNDVENHPLDRQFSMGVGVDPNPAC